MIDSELLASCQNIPILDEVYINSSNFAGSTGKIRIGSLVLKH